MADCSVCGHAADRHDNPPSGPDPGWTDLDMWPCDCGRCDGYQESARG